MFKDEGYDNVDGSDMSAASLEIAKQKVNSLFQYASKRFTNRYYIIIYQLPRNFV